MKSVALQPKPRNRCNPFSRLLSLTKTLNFSPPDFPGIWDRAVSHNTAPCGCRSHRGRAGRQDAVCCRRGDSPACSGSWFQLAPRGTATWIQRMKKPTTRNRPWRSGNSPPAPIASARCSNPSSGIQNDRCHGRRGCTEHWCPGGRWSAWIPKFLLLADSSSPPQVYSSSEFLAAHSNLSLSSSDRSHSEDKEERWDRHSGDEDRSRLSGTEPRCVLRRGMQR